MASASTRAKQRRAQIGRRNSNWRGGRSVDSNGYVTVPRGKRGGAREYEHIVKARSKRGQRVHHRNANRADNSRGNIVATRRHRGQAKRK